MIPDLQAVSTLIRDVATAEILPRFRCLASGDVREKGPGDLVTIADEAAERALTAGLTALLPGSLVVGEEAAAADPAVLDRLSGEEPVWIVDPVDGTSNFVAGHSRFGVIVALACQGETLAGWIYDPSAERLDVAAKGRGATLEGRPAHPHPPKIPAEAIGMMTRRLTLQGPDGPMEALASRVGGRRATGSSALEYLSLLAGEVDFVLAGRLMPWDHAAGALMLTEAGGYAGRLTDGVPYTPRQRDGGLLVGGNRNVWPDLRRTLLGL